MNEPVLRPAALADIRAVAEFQTRAWRQAYAGLVDPGYLDRTTVEDREVRWRRRFVTGEREIALAVAPEPDGEIVGVVSWGRGRQPDGLPDLELTSLYVDARHHGTGVARALSDRAIADEPAWLWVFEQNARARAFYAKLGFRPFGAAAIDPGTGVREIRMSRTGRRPPERLDAATGPHIAGERPR